MSYTFRIKPGCTFEQLIVDVLEHPEQTQQELKDNGGHSWNDIWAVYALSRYADNFTVSKSGANYTDVMPSTTVIQEAGEVHTTAQPHQPYDGPSVLWPEVPRILSTEDMSWFRKPSWYSRMEAMVDAGRHISLAGPPGIGKSSAVEYLAAERGKVLVNVSADAGLRRRDLTGNVELVNSHTQFQVALYLAAVKYGWWVKIDEVNAAEPDALMYLNSQIAPPYSASFYGKSVDVHKDFRLFVTYNPGLVGTKPLPPAFKDRFFPIQLAFPNKAQLRRMLEANGMPPDENSNAIVAFGLAAWEAHKKGRMRYQITPRRLMDAVTLVSVGEDVFSALEQAVICAVDNQAEASALGDVLSRVKQEYSFGRM